jgi:hypothetical protein
MIPQPANINIGANEAFSGVMRRGVLAKVICHLNQSIARILKTFHLQRERRRVRSDY